MTVHEVAEQGFGRAAETYERVRPSYPADAVAWLAHNLRIGPGRRVLDLAAGTGKFTRLLVPLRATLLAAEPVDGMRHAFVAAVPGVPMVSPFAVVLPVTSGSLGAVTVPHAFRGVDVCRAADKLVLSLLLE